MSRRGTWRSSDVAWQGGRRPYDLLKEVTISGAIVAVLVVGLSLLFASPDPPSLTMKAWATEAPRDFVATTLSELDGTSASATYGPPYQTSVQDGSTQSLGPISPQTWLGETIPVDPEQDFVVRPLGTVPDRTGLVPKAIESWTSASAEQQKTWAAAYRTALGKASFGDGYDVVSLSAGPLPLILRAQYDLAVAGGLDDAFMANEDEPSIWFGNDQTFALLYFGDSGDGGGSPSCISAGEPLPVDDGCWYYNQSLANTAPRYGGYLDGGTWGVMNEVGNWPGAWWLAPYSFWYQWGYGATGAAGDLYAMIATALVFALPALFLPWIPGLRSIPRLTRVYRVMWGDYYRLVEEAPPTASTGQSREGQHREHEGDGSQGIQAPT